MGLLGNRHVKQKLVSMDDVGNFGLSIWSHDNPINFKVPSGGYSTSSKNMQTYEFTILKETTAGIDQYSQYSSEAYTNGYQI